MRLLLSIAVLLAIPLHSFAKEVITVYQGIKLEKPIVHCFSDGHQVTDSVYYIETREQLLWWALNGSDVPMELKADIYLQDGKAKLLRSDGYPMRDDNRVTWPKVTLGNTTINGNGHTIYGLYQNGGVGVPYKRNSVNYDEENVGFISSTGNTFSIRNLHIADSYILGTVAGGFLGQKSKSMHIDETEFINCSFSGHVVGQRHAGGFVGWYRTDGQDARFYRCVNYGTVDCDGEENSKTPYDESAGGLVGYLDVCHTAFSQADIFFNRCVNYGLVRGSRGGSVAGVVGKVWDNNAGKREWRFCFNFGDVKKKVPNSDASITLTGSGLLGNYQNANGKSQPKLLCCGNAKPADTGTLIDSCVWNFSDHAPLVVQGMKTVPSQKVLSSMTEDNSAAAWMANHYGLVTVVSIMILLTILTAGIAAVSSAAAAEAGYLAIINEAFGYGATAANTVVPASIITSAVLKTLVITLSSGFLISGGTFICCYNPMRESDQNRNLMAQANLVYGSEDIKRGYYAFDANSMMRADTIDDKANRDTTILFTQKINKLNVNDNDSIPSIASTDGTDQSNMLYFGYDRCNPTPLVCNDPTLRKTPAEHTYGTDGVCTYCHTAETEPTAVHKPDGVTVDYYTVSNYANLRYIASVFNGERPDKYEQYRGATFKVTADIKAPENAMWTPIGSTTKQYSASDGADSESDKFHPFEGVFDGQGHTISGLRTSRYTNYAGLFGQVTSTTYNADAPSASVIKDVRLSDCTFSGQAAGSVMGYLGGSTTQVNGSAKIERVAVDNNVAVVGSGLGENSCAGALIGKSSTTIDYGAKVLMSYSNATVIGEGNGVALGAFVGYAENMYDCEYGLFQNCYFGGYGATTVVGKTLKPTVERHDKADDTYPYGTMFYNCFAAGESEALFPAVFTSNTKQPEAKTMSRFLTHGQVANGTMAYELMTSTHTAGGKYLFKQTDVYPDFDSSDMPSLYNVVLKMAKTGTVLGDTIVNLNAKQQLQAPLRYANSEFATATLHTIAADKTETVAKANDFSAIYSNADAANTFAIYIDADVPDERVVTTPYGWKGIPALGGYKATSIAANLYLTGDNAFRIAEAPVTLDGGYHKLYVDCAVIADRSRLGGSASQHADNINLKNLMVVGDTLCESTAGSKLRLENVILKFGGKNGFYMNAMPNGIDKDNDLYYNSAAYWKNVVSVSADSTMMFFFENRDYGTESGYPTMYSLSADGVDMTGMFSNLPGMQYYNLDKQAAYKDNYESLVAILNKLYTDWQSVFGFRLEGKNCRMAGKFGFATEPDKRIYTCTLYRQADGQADGQVLMNYDGQVVLEQKKDKSVTVHEGGIPSGYFAVLPVTKAELGDNFSRLGTNTFTSDGYAACVHLDDAQDGGFAYPSVFATTDITLHASRAEYARKLYRDGWHETICLPFAFGTLEYEDGQLDDGDKLDICYLDPTDGGLADGGKEVRLKSAYTYLKAKYDNPDYNPSADTGETTFNAGVPYLLSLTCKERTDSTSAVTFVGNDVDLLRQPSDEVSPLFGSFRQVAASDLANGNNMMLVLGVFADGDSPCEKFVTVTGDYRLSPYRAYLRLPNSDKLGALRLVIDGNGGGTTGIAGVRTDAANGNTYDLGGRRVDSMRQPGVYIRNGKKVLVLK